MRGEYHGVILSVGLSEELPPRARRIPGLDTHPAVEPGTTSACAENTHQGSAPVHPHRNYLRVRGEYDMFENTIIDIMELPPRARRIPFRDPRIRVRHGTTSACAENTCRGSRITNSARNYLRVRGEYQASESRSHRRGELPPRARRILLDTIIKLSARGTTSACAENTRHIV